MRQFDAKVVRHVVGVEMEVVLEEIAKVILTLARHGVPPKIHVRRGKLAEVPRSVPRHERAVAQAPP
jgi:hypothetical protein